MLQKYNVFKENTMNNYATKMSKFLETYNLSRLNQKHIKTLKKSVPNREIYSIIKNLKISKQEASLVTLSNINNDMHPTLLKF